jgi:glycosyltransferase involved in cell wall biosynthesis
VTIHDASTLDHPEWFSGAFAKWYRFLLPRLARRARKIITVSEFSRGELARLCDVPLEKIAAIHNGISSRFAPASTEQKTVLRKKHGLEKPFVLYLGSLEPRKNVAALLAAWKNIAPREHELVLAGAASRIFRERGFADLPPGTRLLGRVDDEELPVLLSAAEWFAFPALYEGFGFPPLEAMACGTPVLCSNATSLPEVCGAGFDGKTGAALYFDPLNVDDLTAQLGHALQLDGEARERLIAQGRAQAGRFTWDRCAEQTRAVLREAA